MTTNEFVDTIFDNKEVPAYFNVNHRDLRKWLEEYARIKCLEAIKNTRHVACDIITEHTVTHPYTLDVTCDPTDCTRDIQNIKNKDVLPEF